MTQQIVLQYIWITSWHVLSLAISTIPSRASPALSLSTPFAMVAMSTASTTYSRLPSSLPTPPASPAARCVSRDAASRGLVDTSSKRSTRTRTSSRSSSEAAPWARSQQQQFTAARRVLITPQQQGAFSRHERLHLRSSPNSSCTQVQDLCYGRSFVVTLVKVDNNPPIIASGRTPALRGSCSCRPGSNHLGLLYTEDHSTDYRMQGTRLDCISLRMDDLPPFYTPIYVQLSMPCVDTPSRNTCTIIQKWINHNVQARLVS